MLSLKKSILIWPFYSKIVKKIRLFHEVIWNFRDETSQTVYGKNTVVFMQQKESSGKCLLCISIKQRIDNMYTQVAIHSATIGSLAVSQFFSLLLLTAGNWMFSSSLFSWTSFSFFDSLDGVCRS